MARPRIVWLTEAGSAVSRSVPRKLTRPPVIAGRLARQDAQDGARQRGLAAAAFADQAQDLAAVDRQADAVEDRGEAGLGGKPQRQVFDRQQRRHFAPAPRRMRGSRKSRSPSPSRLKPMTTMKMATPGHGRVPPRLGQEFARFGDHAAPFRRRRRGAQPQEAQRRRGQDGAAHADRRAHDDGRGDVGQHVQGHHAQRRGAERDRRFDEHLVLQRARFGEHQAGPERPVGDAERQDDVFDRRAQRLGDGDRQHDLRHRQEHVGDAHQEIARPAAVVAGEEADRHADHDGGSDGDNGDGDGDAGAEQDATQQIAAHPVGAQPVHGVGRAQAVGGVEIRDVAGKRRQDRREDRRHDQQEQQRQAQCRGAVACEPAQPPPPARHLVLPADR